MKKQPNPEELLKLAKGGGNDAVLMVYDKVIELEEEVSTLKDQISKDPPEDIKIEKVAMRLASKLAQIERGADGKDGVDGADGENYILTEQDKKDIAKSIDVPVVEKIIERTEVIKEQPIVTEITKVTNEIKEVAISDTPDQVVDKVNQSNKQIDPSQVRGLSDIERMAKANSVAVPPTTTHFYRDGQFIGRAKNINMVNSAVQITGDQANITPITVSTTAPSNPFLNQLWLDIN